MEVERSLCSQCGEETLVVILQDIRIAVDDKTYVADELTVCRRCLFKAMKIIQEKQLKG